MASTNTAPSRVIRSASHFGTWPPWSGKSALPDFLLMRSFRGGRESAPRSFFVPTTPKVNLGGLSNQRREAYARHFVKSGSVERPLGFTRIRVERERGDLDVETFAVRAHHAVTAGH